MSSKAASRALIIVPSSAADCLVTRQLRCQLCDRFALMRILLVFCLCVSLVAGASLPTAAPQQAGFSRDRRRSAERRFRPNRSERQGDLPGDLGNL